MRKSIDGPNGLKARMGLLAAALPGIVAGSSSAGEISLQPMPPGLETRFALSALPPPLRSRATVHVLDPGTGYQLVKQGTSGVTCLVERTAWELADFRDDIFIPLCYDAAGSRTYLKVIMDAAALRAQGMGPVDLKNEVTQRFRNGTYTVPGKPGLSYMLAPLMRTVGPPDMKVRTMAMPHFMFYAPHLSDEDIGAAPDLRVPSTLRYPFIDRQGIPEQSYIIQLVGEHEKKTILVDEKPLLDELCAYRRLLCLPRATH